MIKKISLEIDDGLSGRRIESLLKKPLNLSGTLIKRLKNTPDSLLLNGEAVRLKEWATKGDVLEVFIPEKKSAYIEKAEITIHPLYEDEDIIVVDKPFGMPTHPSKNHEKDTLLNALAHYFNEDITSHVITRLDRETSGVVLVAKNALSAKILTEEMVNKNILKEYEAILKGVPEVKEGIINAPIKRTEEGIKREVSENGKEAVTKYKVIEVKEGLSRVWLCPVTGRTHQLRVHMSYIGTPIYGDGLYGEAVEGERCHLHCKKISFLHPVTKEKVFAHAKLPSDMDL